MKGAELPINVMIIVVLAIIVLIAIVVLFFGVWNPGKGTMSLETAKDNACNMLIGVGCTTDPASIVINNFDANNDGTISGGIAWTWGTSTCSSSTTKDNLASLCACYYGISTADACRQLCGC